MSKRKLEYLYIDPVDREWYCVPWAWDAAEFVKAFKAGHKHV